MSNIWLNSILVLKIAYSFCFDTCQYFIDNFLIKNDIELISVELKIRLIDLQIIPICPILNSNVCSLKNVLKVDQSARLTVMANFLEADF